MLLCDRLRVDSYYVASVFGVVFDCAHNTKGIIHTLQMPEAQTWTNYSIEFRAYSDYTMFGVVFRYQVSRPAFATPTLTLDPVLCSSFPD